MINQSLNTVRWPLALAWALWTPNLAASAPETETPYGEVSLPYELHQVGGKPVYYLLGRSGVPSAENEGHTSNLGFVVTGDGVVVYDAGGTPAVGYMLIKRIREVTDKPIKIVVAGHYHADHVYGLQAFKEHTDAVIWAQRRALDYFTHEIKGTAVTCTGCIGYELHRSESARERGATSGSMIRAMTASS